MFRIQGLDPNAFAPAFDQSPAWLEARTIERHTVTAKPGAPCRITLEDAEIGETVLLLSHRHQPAQTPYGQSGPIFVRETAT